MATNNIFSLLRLANIFGGGNQSPQQSIGGTPPIVDNRSTPELIGGFLQDLMRDFGSVNKSLPGTSTQFGMAEPGNIDMSNRPRVTNPDGSISNEYAQNLHNSEAPKLDSAPQPDQSYNPDKDFLSLYKPRTSISDAYTQSLLNPPERSSPGTLRNIGALIGSTLTNLKTPNKALETFNDVRFAPYNRAAEDWATRTKALGLGANEEDKSNTNARLLAQEQVRSKENEARINETERAHKASEADKIERTRIANARAQAYIWRQTHPNWVPLKTKGGNVIFANPTNPQDTYDTGIPQGSMTDQDLQNLITNRQMGEIAARGNIQEDIANKRNQTQQDLQDKRAWSVVNVPDPTDPSKLKAMQLNTISGEMRELPVKGPITKTVTSGTTGNKALTPSQEVTADYRKAKQAVLEHPEWANFIHIDDTHKSFTVDAPSTGGFFSSGPDRNTYNSISSYLTGKQMQQFDPKIEKTISDALNLPGKPYKSRDEVIAALKQKGVIK